MSDFELISACVKGDKAAKKTLFENYYGKLLAISLRYAKNKEQAEDLLNKGVLTIFSELSQFKSESNEFDKWLTKQFIKSIVANIKSIRQEYYVASTVKASASQDNTYDLFVNNEFIDFKSIDYTDLLKALHALVPSHRLVFNLQVIDEFSLKETSELLEANEYTIKSNLEKARFNLQKNIENTIKTAKNE